mmetsp:Transcript_82066/g.211480  ORF Transcript_82066/g.211480 Transcript_82066/m.211480 type:complete len:206 (-) Transcript_82066:847-1464(-)
MGWREGWHRQPHYPRPLADRACGHDLAAPIVRGVPHVLRQPARRGPCIPRCWPWAAEHEPCQDQDLGHHLRGHLQQPRRPEPRGDEAGSRSGHLQDCLSAVGGDPQGACPQRPQAAGHGRVILRPGDFGPVRPHQLWRTRVPLPDRAQDIESALRLRGLVPDLVASPASAHGHLRRGPRVAGRLPRQAEPPGESHGHLGHEGAHD